MRTPHLIARASPVTSGGPRRSRVVLALAIALALSATGVLAFWTAPGSGTATAISASLTAGAITVPGSATGALTVTWSEQASLVPAAAANSEITYTVQRRLADEPYAAVTSGDCSGLKPRGIASCIEVPPAAGSYGYRVVATYATWTAISAESGAVAFTPGPYPSFVQPATSPEIVADGPAGLATGDVDNDGDEDIVASAIFAPWASVLINNGVGDFRQESVASNAATIDAGLGRFDNDAYLDLVLLYQQTPPSTGLLVIFKGGGNGTFTYLGNPNTIVSTGVRPLSIAVGDFNADLIDDVAVVNQQNTPATQLGTVTTHLGNPAGNDAFASATPTQTLTAQLGASDIAYADFDGGAKDLVVTNHASSSITFLRGNGAGFEVPTQIPVGEPVLYLDTGSFDQGTNRDIVATVKGSNPSAIRTLFGDGAGGFPAQATTAAAPAGTGADPQGVVAKDFDNDGDTDVALGNATSTGVSVVTNDGSGSYTIAPGSPLTNVGQPGVLPFGLATGDFDASGYQDIALSNFFTAPGEVRVLGNQNGDRADLSITVSDAPDPVIGGDNLAYTLTVANAGPASPSSVKASHTLPVGVTFDAAGSSSSCSAAGAATVTVTCDFGAVTPGTPETQQIVVGTSSATPLTLTSTLTVSGNLADPSPPDNRATATTTVLDRTGPTGGSVDATGLVGTGSRYSTTPTLSVAFTKGTDPSGLASTGAQLHRSTATLSAGGCGSYGPAVQVGADDPVSPAADTVPAGEACHRYDYTVSDTAGNATTYTSPDVKVDTSAPAAPGLVFTATSNAHWAGGTSTTVHYRPGAASGSFTATATSSDAGSGIASYTLPALGSGWTAPTGTSGFHTYAWSAADPVAPVGPQAVTATNHASAASPAASFTVIADAATPAGGSVTHLDGYSGTPGVAVTFGDGSDDGAGVDPESRLLQRATASLADGTCGNLDTFTTIATGSGVVSPYSDAGAVGGSCYRYRYQVSDNVGNQAVYTTASIARIDTTAPTVSRARATKITGSGSATIRQGGDYYVYAQVTDNGSVSTVTADTGSFDSGVTAAALSPAGGPWTVDGLAYSHRSAILTADTGLTTGASHDYAVSASDAAANSAAPFVAGATIETYDAVISGTPGLISYWSFNDAVVAGDEFTGAAGTLISDRTGAVGATWIPISGQARTAVLTSANRLRKETGSGGAQYYASGVPAAANYLVEADVHVATLLAGDATAVSGRHDVSGTGQTFYMARYVVDSGRWELAKVIGGAFTLIGTGSGVGFYTQALTPGNSHRMTLRMDGSVISLLVDGVSRITATDVSITATGRGGIRPGTSASASAVTDTAGLHLDNFRISSLATAASDSRTAANHGTLTGGPRVNEPGALAGDGSRALLLDGTNDHVKVPHATTLNLGDGPFTLEAWIKRSNAGTAWMNLFQKGGSAFQLGLVDNAPSLAKDNVGVITGSTATIADSGWHHVVATKSGVASKLYVDGIDRTGTITNLTLVNTSAALILGAKNGTSEFFAGAIDEFAVYNTVLDLPTVVDHHKAGLGTG